MMGSYTITSTLLFVICAGSVALSAGYFAGLKRLAEYAEKVGHDFSLLLYLSREGLSEVTAYLLRNRLGH